jgi:hypothetical protein
VHVLEADEHVVDLLSDPKGADLEGLGSEPGPRVMMRIVDRLSCSMGLGTYCWWPSSPAWSYGHLLGVLLELQANVLVRSGEGRRREELVVVST